MKPEGESRINWQELRRMAPARRWWFLGPLFAFGLAGAIVPHFLTPRYESQAFILVQQQQVPTQLVAPNVSTSAGDRLQALTQQILSRPRLQHLIDTLGLYQGERAHMSEDQIVDRMAKDISTTTVTSPDQPDQLTGFRITYSAATPLLAQRVVSELTSLFIEDSYNARAQQSASTTQFLQTQLQAANQSLQQAEDRLRDFKQQHLGELPEQEQGNLDILTSLRTQYSAAADSLARAEQDKTYFESLENEYQQDPTGALVNDPNSPAAQLQMLRIKLADLEATHTDAYPDVIATRDQIARLQKQIEATPAATNGKTAASAPAKSAVAIEAASRLQAINLQIKDSQTQMNELQKRINQIQQSLNVTPVLEQSLSALTQGVADAQKNYESLLARNQESQLATNLEENQEGERFQVIDPASLPTQPAFPNVMLFLIGGWLLGAAMGFGLFLLRELMDGTVTGEAALTELTTVPLLATVPTLDQQQGRLRRWSFRGLEVATVIAVCVVAFAAVWV